MPTEPLSGSSPDSEGAPSVFSVVGALLFGVLTAILTLVVIVAIRPLGWRFLVTALLWLPSVAALIVFSDGLDRLLPGRRERLAAEALHWLSASFVALALAVVLGAFLPSLLSVSVSPPPLPALGCDALIGVSAGLLTLGLTALSGLLGGELSYRVVRMSWVSEARPERFRSSLRDVWSWPEAGRTIALAVAGVLASAGATELAPGVPSQTAAPGADTVPKLPSVASSIVLPLVVWGAVTALVWFGFSWVASRRRKTRSQTASAPPDEQSLHRRRRATHASALAVGLAVLIGWGSAWALNDLIQGSLSTHGTVPGVSIQSVPGAQRIAYLAQKFRPRFELARGEHWQPTTVNWYVAHSNPNTAATFCVPGPKTEPQGCRQLCAMRAGTLCAPPCDDPVPQTCAPIGGNPHAVYYRYRDAGNTPRDRPARGGHDWAVIEYWIFYNYDSLSAGLITQWHQSDWEQVSVLLQRRASDMYPVEVGFSEHCYGAVVPATKVAWTGSHPVSYVGLGSHANYPTQNAEPIRQLQCLTRQTPRYLGVSGLFFNPQIAGWSLELPVVYLIGLRDQTGHASTISTERVISQRATPSIWSFHGYWGLNNNLQLVAGDVPTSAGPESPQDQGASRKPFRNMFCNSSWLKISPTAATAWVC